MPSGQTELRALRETDLILENAPALPQNRRHAKTSAPRSPWLTISSHQSTGFIPPKIMNESSSSVWSMVNLVRYRFPVALV